MGDKGPDGNQGPKGDEGDKGIAGEAGGVGPVGSPGPGGPAGPDATGVPEKGDKGKPGANGSGFKCDVCKAKVFEFTTCVFYNKKDFGKNCFRETLAVKNCYTNCLGDSEQTECETEFNTCITKCDALNSDDGSACSHSTVEAEKVQCKAACPFIKQNCNRRCNCIERKETFCPSTEAKVKCGEIHPNIYLPYLRYTIRDNSNNSITTDNTKFAQYGTGTNDKHHVIAGHVTPRIVFSITEFGTYKIQYCDANLMHPNLYYLGAERVDDTVVSEIPSNSFHGNQEIISANETGVNFGKLDLGQSWSVISAPSCPSGFLIKFNESTDPTNSVSNVISGHNLRFKVTGQSSGPPFQIIVHKTLTHCWKIEEC